MTQTLIQRLNTWLDEQVLPLREHANKRCISIVDQRLLPYRLDEVTIDSFDGAFNAITTMQVRGAPLIGICAAYGVAMALASDASDIALTQYSQKMKTARPTAVNLAYAVDYLYDHLIQTNKADRADVAWQLAKKLNDADWAQTMAIGLHGLRLIEKIAQKKQGVTILTHCNAGRLATAGIGTALAPIYCAQLSDIKVQVYVDETRPRNQGFLTAWELLQANIDHQVIVDNAGGYFMQHGLIDICFVGADRVSRTGDVCNKIGTYLKALAAKDNQIPFYAAFPEATIDWNIADGINDIPIELRSADEIRQLSGLDQSGHLQTLTILAGEQHVENPGFDVTPARLMTGYITETGIYTPDHFVSNPSG